MPQLNSSSSSEVEPNATADQSKNEAKSEVDTYRRRLRTRSKNPEPESPEKSEEPEKSEKKPAKKATKRKQPAEKKTAAKSSKSRGSRKKADEGQPKSKNTQTDVQHHVIKTEMNVDDDEDDEDMEEGEIPSSIAAESRTYYSCKLCHKDFSSAFILCLHLQIHEKVANTKVTEEDSSTVVKEESKNCTIKIERDADISANAETEGQEPSVIKVENCEPTGLINKNFVENLKKNLSIAMARNNL